MKVLGLMSGTSADGVDAALVEIHGAPPNPLVELLSFTYVPFDAEQRARIFALFDPATGTVDRICHMNFAVGEWFAAAALQAIVEAGLTPDEVALIGSHGQTIYHAVGPNSPIKSTLQIGEAAVIAARTGITTVSDFRVADVAAGGQGAPLVSYVDWRLPGSEELARATGRIMERRSMVLWQYHGIVAAGPDLDAAFGLIDTAEKAADIYLKVAALGPVERRLNREQLRALAQRFSVEPDPEILAEGE